MDGYRPVADADLEASNGDPLLGSTLAERYTVVGKLGSGGMGTVYRAEQAPIGRDVALKVLRRDLGRDPETVARFQREARALSQLKHPNTVTIFDFGQTDDGLLYLAMELLDGEMLSSRLKAVGPMDVCESIRIATGVLRSLDEAHARGIIHRDLKPDNIFLAQVHGRPAEAEVVKVVDFGIAKIRHGDVFPGLDPVATQEGTVFGTPRYMSPEQAQGKSLDGRSDLYAVGVLLFHMLTGAAPFTDDDAVIVMAHHIKTVPPPVTRAAPGSPIPPSLDLLVSRALAKDPDERPQSATDFLAALEHALVDVQPLRMATAVPPATASVPPPAVGRRAWAGAFAAASLVLAAVIGLSTLASRQSVRALTATVAQPPATRQPASSESATNPPEYSPVARLARVQADPAPAQASTAVSPTGVSNAPGEPALLQGPGPGPTPTPSPDDQAVPAGLPASAIAPPTVRGAAERGVVSGQRPRRRRAVHGTQPEPEAPAQTAPARPTAPAQIYHRWND